MSLNDCAGGRWLTPGRLAGNIMNPQSLNRYAYVLNNPVSNIDPTGLSCIHTDDGTTADNGDGKGCSEMNNTPQQENVEGTAPSGAEYYAGLMQLAAYGSMYSMIGAVSGSSAAGVGGGTPAKPQTPTPKEKQCAQDANARAQDAIWHTYTEVWPELGKTVLEGSIGGAVTGCLQAISKPSVGRS